MAAKESVSASVTNVQQGVVRALDVNTSAAYDDLLQQVSRLDAAIRETVQTALSQDYQAIIHKLEANESLSGAQLELLELLIVGEAKYYVRHEKNIENWRSDLQRLAEELDRVEESGLDDIENLMQLRALCRDALSVLPDLAFYFREKERVQNFKSATTGDLDRETRKILADLIRAMMASDTM